MTFETMRRARAFAAADEGLAVELYTAQYAEDRRALAGFHATPDLERSVLDFGAFPVERKLPLIGDVLGRLREASKADYFIYTNVDIALKPEFYTSVAEFLKTGLDAAVINRRTIRCTEEQANDLEWLYAQTGEKHIGWDCFVFKRSLLEGFDFHALVIGAVPIGQTLLAVLSTLAERFQLYEEAALTFHLGDDRTWRNPQNDPFHRHNFKEARKIVQSLRDRGRPLSPWAETLAERLKSEPAL